MENYHLSIYDIVNTNPNGQYSRASASFEIEEWEYLIAGKRLNDKDVIVVV
ncbi:MAG: hypothetical protein ACR2M8_06545 [Pyrinomonadaceae bacterium]